MSVQLRLPRLPVSASISVYQRLERQLDNRSHRSKQAQEIDQFKNQALAAADITLIRIPAKMRYTEDYIRSFIFNEEASATSPGLSPSKATKGVIP